MERAGYRLVAANFRLPVGRNLRGAVVQTEIDLVAYEGATLCFVEVKTRASDRFAAPEANVDLRKQRQITRAARAYRRAFGVTAAPYRYDVVSLVLPQKAPSARRTSGRAPSCSATSGRTPSFASVAARLRRSVKLARGGAYNSRRR